MEEQQTCKVDGALNLKYEAAASPTPDAGRIAHATISAAPDGRTLVLTEHHSESHPHPTLGDRDGVEVRYEITPDELVRLIIAHGAELTPGQ